MVRWQGHKRRTIYWLWHFVECEIGRHWFEPLLRHKLIVGTRASQISRKPQMRGSYYRPRRSMHHQCPSLLRGCIDRFKVFNASVIKDYPEMSMHDNGIMHLQSNFMPATSSTVKPSRLAISASDKTFSSLRARAASKRASALPLASHSATSSVMCSEHRDVR
jgi:hypothetical protein